jgi:hypothetical protein
MWHCKIEEENTYNTVRHNSTMSSKRRDWLILNATDAILDEIFVNDEFTRFEVFKKLFKLERVTEFHAKDEEGSTYVKITIWEE